MARTRAKGVWIATESTYDTDPDNTGAAYVSIPALEIGDLQDKKDPLEANYYTGRPFPSVGVEGVDGWEFTLTVPLIGLANAAGDGETVVAEDWMDLVLKNSLGTPGTTDGEGLAAATASTMTLDASAILADQDFVPVYDAATNRSHAQWALVTDDAADPALDVAPDFAETPTATADAYGTRYYAMTDAFAGGSSISFVYRQDELKYLCTGGQVTAVTITGEVGQIVTMQLTIMGASKVLVDGTHASLPVQAAAPATTPLKALCSPVFFGGTAYATRRFEIDFGLQGALIEATSSCTGKVGTDVLGAAAMVTIEPLRTDAILELKRQVTTGRMHVQLGGGEYDATDDILNAMGIHFGNAYAQSVEITDDNGRMRQVVQFKIVDGGAFEATAVATEYFRIARG